MSYIKVNLGGKERGLKFNQLAIEVIGLHNNSGTNTGFIYAMFYGGLKGNSFVKGEEPDYTFEDVCDWVDGLENKEGVIALVTNAMSETQIWKSLVKKGQEIVDEEEKKKVSKSKPTTT